MDMQKSNSGNSVVDATHHSSDDDSEYAPEGVGYQQPIDGRIAEEDDSDLLECGCTMEGRALVVCLDRASNNFGQNNTNVVELYHRVIKNERQLTYYNSGVGTYTKPSWRSFTYWKWLVFNVIDMVIAWNFEKTVLDAYRWLSLNYKEGDRVYLFGFSRGAYQVRVLAAMIHKVGLIFPGNEEQIPIAYELYADPKSGQCINSTTRERFGAATQFKQTFSREDIRVHFIGVWDTVSSIGVFGSGSLPLTDTCEPYCYMRHALALDERRVKFLPEYAQGGESWVQNPAQVSARDGQFRPRVKEVWFAGSHSDIGGGVKSNTELNNTTIPALWMGNETTMARLELRPSRAVQDWEKLKEDRPTESLSFIWWILELFPLKHLSYKSTSSTCWRPHFANPRIIKPGQKIHASVAFVGDYHPRAKFFEGAPVTYQWNRILSRSNTSGPKWLGDLLEPA